MTMGLCSSFCCCCCCFVNGLEQAIPVFEMIMCSAHCIFEAVDTTYKIVYTSNDAKNICTIGFVDQVLCE